MEFFLFVKLAKVEILLIAMMALCFINGKKRTSKATDLIWPSLLCLVYWQLISPEQWSSSDGNLSLSKWQFTIKFGLIVHAGMCWRFAKDHSFELLGKWLCILLLCMFLVIPSKAPVTVGACFISHLLLVIFTFNRNKRLKNIFFTTCLMSLFAGLFWWFNEPSPIIIFMQWLPILSLLFSLSLMGNYCKNHTDTDLKKYVFYCSGLVCLLALHFCVLKTIAWSPVSINVDIAVIAKIGLAWAWVLLGFQWSLPPNNTSNGYSLLIPLGLILTLFIQMTHAKTFQLLLVFIPVFFIQFWWLAHFYQSQKSAELFEPLLLLLNCLIILILNWWIDPVPMGLWNFSPTLTTLFCLVLILAIFGIFRRRKSTLQLNCKLFFSGLIVSIAIGYFMSTISSNLYLHIRDEYKESMFVLEPVKS